MQCALSAQLQSAQNAYLEGWAPGVRGRRVAWAGGTTQLLELGEGNPVLLLHGGLGEAFQWAPVLSALALEHRVLAVDRPGHGLADPFDYRGVDLLAHARCFLRDVLDAENIPCLPIVAASMGGLWAMAFALEFPQRVSQLIFAGPPAGIVRSQPLHLRLGTLPLLKWMVRKAMRNPTRDSTRQFWSQLLVVHPEQLGDDLLDLLTLSQKRNVESWLSLIDAAITLSGLRQSLLLDPCWEELTVPTTFVWGEQDAWACPSKAEALLPRNPNLRLVRVPDAGHGVWFDAPECFAAIVTDLLNGTYPAV
jgi:pimeloyl-ACP methyl ester carboxylesterase